MMNERKNDYRSVNRAEVEADHLFKATRHFPELRQSLRAVNTQQVDFGRDMTTTKKYNNEGKVRPKQLKSTNYLDTLTGSVVDELQGMTHIRGVLLGERARIRDLRAQERSIVDRTHELSPLERANEKLTKASVSFNALSANNDLSGFQGRPLTVTELDVQLKRCLNIKLKSDELAAVFRVMDLDDSKDIDGVEFTRYFFKLGSDAIALMRKRELEREEKEREEKRRLEEEEARRRKEYEAAHIAPFTEEEKESAMKKLARRAYFFDHNHFIDVLLVRDFACHLSPYQFISQLEESFSISLSKAEYGALVNIFKDPDAQDDGGGRLGIFIIDGDRFVKEFKRLQRVERKIHEKTQREMKVLRQKVSARGQFLDYQSKSLGR
jgi:hypothetical protein